MYGNKSETDASAIKRGTGNGFGTPWEDRDTDIKCNKAM